VPTPGFPETWSYIGPDLW